MDPDPVTDIKPLTNGHHATHSIADNEANDASILSNHIQDFKNTLEDASNDTLADDLIATRVQSVLKTPPTQFTEVAPLTMQSNSESQTELSHSIGVSDMDATAGSTLENPSTSTDSVPPNREQDEASTVTDVHVEEPLQEVIMPSTSEQLTTDSNATSDNEEQPIEEAITTTSDYLVPAINDASDADKGAVMHSEAISSEIVQDPSAQLDAGTTSISDTSLDTARPFSPDAATDISPDLDDAVTTNLLGNPTVDTVAEDAAAPDVAGESTGSDFAEIVADIPTAENEDEQVETLATSLTSEHVEPSTSVELAADSVDPVHESTPTTSSVAHISEPYAVEPLGYPLDDSPAEVALEPTMGIHDEETPAASQEPTTYVEPSLAVEVPTSAANDVEDAADVAALEPTMEIHDEETPAASQEPTTYVEPSLAAEVPTSVANDVEDAVLPTGAADVAVSSDTMEVDGHLTDNPTESEAPGLVDAFGPVPQDTTIVESVTEHVEVCVPGHVSSSIIAVPTAGIESVRDAAPLSETAEHALESETITLNGAAEHVHVGSSQAVDSSRSDLVAAEEASGPAMELVDEDDAALHVHPQETVDLTITDADPVDRELLQYIESTEEPLDIADHDLLVENELGKDIHFSDSETDEVTSNAEVHEVEQEPPAEIAVEELGAQMAEATSAVPEVIDKHPASGPDDNLPQEQLATTVASDLPPDEANTAPGVDDEKVIETSAVAVDPVINEASAPAESSEDVTASAISEAQLTLETTPMVSSLVEEATLEESTSAAEAITHIETVEQGPLSVEEPVSQDPEVQQVHQGASPIPEAIDTLPTSELDEEQLLGIPNSEILPEEAKPFEADVPDVIQEENASSAVDPTITEGEPDENIAPSVVSEAEHVPEVAVVESLSVLEETKMEEVKYAEEAMTPHAEVHGSFMDNPIAPELQVQEVTSTMPEAVDNLPVLESESNSKEQAVEEVEPDLQAETKLVEVDAVAEMIEKKTVESSADTSLADEQPEIDMPPADEEHPPNEAQAAPESVEQEARVISDATEPLCEETVAPAEPPHAQHDIVSVGMMSAQEDTTGPVATETIVVASIEEDTQPSFEQPQVPDVEDHLHADAKAVDEELLVHKDPEVPETQEPADVETFTHGVKAAILTGGPAKEETIHTENELSVEESIVKLSFTNSCEPSVEAGATEGAVKEVSVSVGDAPVPDMSNEPTSNQNPDIEIEGTSSTVECHVTEGTPVIEVPPAQDTLVVHEDEMPSAESNDIPSIQAQPTTEAQPPVEEASFTVGPVDDVSIVPTEAAGEPHSTPETTTSVVQGETIQDIAPAVEENIVTPQQSPVEQNALEEASSVARETPTTPEERVVSIPATQDLKSSDISNQESDVIEDTGSRITFVETETYRESVVDTIAVDDLLPSKDDTLKAAEAEIERPKSPWMPSFQVTTVGRGVSSSTEDEQPEFEESTAAPTASSNDIVSVETLVEEKVVTSALEDRSLIEHVGPQLLVDTSSLDTSDELARPWTPSYSVHSQGSPLHSPGVIEQDDQVLEVGAHELPEMKFADNEQISISNALSPSEPMAVPHDSAAKLVETLAGMEITDLANVKTVPSNSGSEEPLYEYTINNATQRLETSVEVDTSFRTEETQAEAEQDSTYDLKHAPQIPRLVLDDFTEAAAPIEAHDSPSGNVHKESSATSSWVPSYSVSRQGSPVRENTKLPEVESVDILDHGHDLSLVDKPSDALADSKAYSEEVVNAQVSKLQITDEEIRNRSETDILVQAILIQGSTVEDVNDLGDTRANDLVVVTDVGESRAQILSHITSVDDSADQPKSPWTPSYSVTVQGPEIATEGQTLTSSRNDVDSQDMGIEYVEISGIREPEKHLVQPEEGTANLTVTLVDFPDSAPQSTLFQVEAGSADSTSQESAPSVDRPTEVLRVEVPQLEPVSETAKLDGLSVEVSPKTRKRLESTTSSRFFPGAWFSTASVVDEGRTSLEIARGEFTPSKPTSPNDDAPDSPVLEDASSTDDEDDDVEPEQAKRRWCVVM